MTIERETQGDEHKKDVLESKAFLEDLMTKTYR
jgi:hypothetical protein